MNEPNEKEISTRDLIAVIKSWIKFLLSKWILITVAVLIFAILGIFYASMQKPVYTAELTFAAENTSASGLSNYSGFAAQFGVDLSAGGGSVFEGNNLMEFLRSRLLVEKTLLTPVSINGREELLINYYLNVNKINSEWGKDTALSRVVFKPGQQKPQRTRDSIMKQFCKQIIDGSLVITKVDKSLSLISVKMSDGNELFAKLFLEHLANNAIQYYIDYKIQKSRQNVQILQKQTDSIRSLLTGNIVSVAVSNDLNVNPIRQVVKANVQRKQVDVQVNSQVYGELLKQLEFAKITLRHETPLIKFIDTPQLPLDKKKIGRLKAAVLFGFIGGFFSVAFIALRKILSS